MLTNKIFILGAGAIGSYFGSQLSTVADVTLIARRNHVDAIVKNGLQVMGEINKIYRIKASTEIEQLPSNSTVIITTKTTDLEKILKSSYNSFKGDTTIVILQNGHGNEEITRKIVGPELEIVRGLINTGVNFLTSGKIEIKLSNPTIIENSPAGRKLGSLFASCGLKVELSDNMETEIWRKLVLNCVINPLTALFRVPNREIAVETFRGLITDIVSECIQVSAAEGVFLDQNMADNIYDLIAQYGNLSSMCQDIIKGKKTEIEFLNGRVSELGKTHGVSTPINDTLSALIRYLEGQR